MNFFAPWFLMGTLVVALPLIFHLSRRTTAHRTRFSSLMFLRPTPPRLTRRNRLEHLLLLLLRCAVIGLLATGFARPFLRKNTPATTTRDAPRCVSVLMDTSASMRRGSLWAEARRTAEAVARQASAADQVAWFTFDQQLAPVITFAQWNSTPAGDRVALVRDRLASSVPSWSGTYLDQALVRAAEALAAAESGPLPGRRQVVLISDLQAGSRLAGLQAHEWPKNVELVVKRLTPRTTSNAGLQVLAESPATERIADPAVRVRVSNEPDSRREQFQVAWARAGGVVVGTPTDVYVPPGQSRVVVLPVPAGNAEADCIILRGDEEEFDNTAFVVPPETAGATVLYFGPEAETDARQPLFFLRRAFQETRRQAVRVVPHPPSAPLSPVEAASADLFVVTEAVVGATAAVLRERVEQGKVLVLAPVSVAAAASVEPLLGLTPAAVQEGTFPTYGMLGEIDFRHPLFASFADARFSDFTKIHFWKHRHFDLALLPAGRVLARFDNGAPAIFEVIVGHGRVLVWAAGWHPADSQLALSSKFVPLLYSVLELAGAQPVATPVHQVGEAVPVRAAHGADATAIAVTRPDGARVDLATGAHEFPQTTMPGIYRAQAGQERTRFAVNLDPAESRTAVMPSDELDRLGVLVVQPPVRETPSAERTVWLKNSELESRQKLWRWAIIASLLVLVLETWLAGQAARRLAVRGEVTA